MKQLNLFDWADNKPSNIIDVMPAIISKIAREPWPPKPQTADVVSLKRKVA